MDLNFMHVVVQVNFSPWFGNIFFRSAIALRGEPGKLILRGDFRKSFFVTEVVGF